MRYLREFTENGTNRAVSASGDADTGTDSMSCCSSSDSGSGSCGREYNSNDRGVTEGGGSSGCVPSPAE